MSNYNVNELFETIQGEGQYTGTPSIFLRLQGCPVGCSWCDTKQTWDTLEQDETDLTAIITKNVDGPSWTTLSANNIVDVFIKQAYTARHVVITGGEPCMFDLNPLCELLHKKGFTTQIETSGTFEIIAPVKTWVTVSPKINMKGGYKVLSSCMARANEVKHPVARQNHVEELEALLEASPIGENTLVYLQPISQKPAATKLAIETCIKKNWRLSIQVHKYIGIS